MEGESGPFRMFRVCASFPERSASLNPVRPRRRRPDLWQSMCFVEYSRATRAIAAARPLNLCKQKIATIQSPLAGVIIGGGKSVRTDEAMKMLMCLAYFHLVGSVSLNALSELLRPEGIRS